MGVSSQVLQMLESIVRFSDSILRLKEQCDFCCTVLVVVVVRRRRRYDQLLVSCCADINLLLMLVHSIEQTPPQWGVGLETSVRRMFTKINTGIKESKVLPHCDSTR